MLQKIKKCIAVLIIIVSLPYIVTVFMSGNGAATEKEVNGPDALVRAHCIGVLAREVSQNYEDEMLKVQALLVRTTVYKEIEEKGKAILEEEGFGDVSDIEGSWYRKLEEVWEETEGQVLMYSEKLALVPFHQVSSGKTRVGSEVLGSEDYPYLKMRECPKDVEADNQMMSKFIDVKGLKVASVDRAGYALTVTVGEETVSAESLRE